jgi:hypothetical protein
MTPAFQMARSIVLSFPPINKIQWMFKMDPKITWGTLKIHLTKHSRPSMKWNFWTQKTISTIKMIIIMSWTQKSSRTSLLLKIIRSFRMNSFCSNKLLKTIEIMRTLIWVKQRWPIIIISTQVKTWINLAVCWNINLGILILTRNRHNKNRWTITHRWT